MPSRRISPYLIATLLWLVAVPVHAWIFVSSQMADMQTNPPPDLYARTADFQLMIFCLFRFPLWVLALGIVVFVMYGLRKKSPSAAA